MVSCTCGREWNADALKSCPACGKTQATLAKLAGQTTTATARTASTGNPTSPGSVDAASIQMMEKAFKSALRSANTDQTEYLRKIHFWMRYFGIVTIAGGVIALLWFVILVANAM